MTTLQSHNITFHVSRQPPQNPRVHVAVLTSEEDVSKSVESEVATPDSVMLKQSCRKKEGAADVSISEDLINILKNGSDADRKEYIKHSIRGTEF
ncbi:MAG: hypothetical protein PWR07_869 [Bacillota bacterium]|nr:hypothetical protein [Bacillota bacterium]